MSKLTTKQLRELAEAAGIDPDDDRRVLVALGDAWERGAAASTEIAAQTIEAMTEGAALGPSALLREAAEQIRRGTRKANAADRLTAAIRRFTVDARDAAGELVPNGPAEAAISELQNYLDDCRDGYAAKARVAEIMARYCEHDAARLRELRKAAEAFFGGDFLSEPCSECDGTGDLQGHGSSGVGGQASCGTCDGSGRARFAGLRNSVIARTAPLRVGLRDQQLTISVGVDVLAWAAEQCSALHEFDADAGILRGPQVTSSDGFAADVLRALEREAEDGTTMVHELLDRACEVAIEQGSEAVADDFGPVSERPPWDRTNEQTLEETS